MILLFTTLLFLLCFTNISCNLTDSVNLGFSNCDKCIAKCCPLGLFVNRKQCVPYPEYLNLSSYPVYTEDIKNNGKVIADYFTLVPGRFNNRAFKNASYNMYQAGFRHYLTENRTLYLELPNAFQRWTKIHPSNYCIDYQLPNKFISTPQVRTWVILQNGEMSEPNMAMTSGFIISCIFLTLVLVVYSLLPELRNLCGKILMAYVASLLCSFILLVAMQKVTLMDVPTCIGMTLPLYFSFMASFCWMNVMSCDIWWTFRGYAKARPIHRRGEMFKFCMYCLYAFGVPLAMTIFLYVVNTIDLTHVPWFVTPKIPTKGCFLEQGQKLYYMYVPMLIMSCMNWIFYLMTAFNIIRLSKGTAVLDSAAAGTPAAHRSHRYRFMVYINLSIFMGLNWIFEVVSSFQPDLKIWWFTDAFNILIGFAIFLVFVCKRKIYKKLVLKLSYIVSRIKGQQRWTPQSKSRSSSTTDSNITQETPLQICTHPKGFA